MMYDPAAEPINWDGFVEIACSKCGYVFAVLAPDKEFLVTPLCPSCVFEKEDEDERSN